jgi:hypothetical protein
MTTQQQINAFYARAEGMTSPGSHAALLESLPADIGELARIVQGLVIHEFVAEPLYGFRVPEARKSESHIRPLSQLLDRILELDARPLAVARPPDKRLVGVCHHFARLYCAMLRIHGVAARCRSGFGSYFNPGYFEDHILVEYRDDSANRWIRADAQLDDIWQQQPLVDFDTFDVPHDRFCIPADAWQQCRAGEKDAAKFGIFRGGLRGLWFIAANLVRDVAALNKVELLQWDVWGGMPKPHEELTHERMLFFDELAEFTREPDASFEVLSALYEKDDRLRVPAVVFNAILQRPEVVGQPDADVLSQRRA